MNESRKTSDERFLIPYEGGYMVLQLAHLQTKYGTLTKENR